MERKRERVRAMTKLVHVMEGLVDGVYCHATS